MRKSVLVLVAVAAAIVVIGFIVTRRSDSNPSPGEQALGTNSGPQYAAPRTSNFTRHLPPPHAPGKTKESVANISAPPPTNTFMTNWEEKLDAILTSDKPDPDKAKDMILMFPQLSPEAQEEIAHHISNLTPDENYAPLASFLTNSALPEAVLDVFTEDVLNRPNSIKLPLLLDIARDQNHPKAGEAKDILELFLEDDYGTDWTKWQARLDQWLKDNPD
jgi:hypothetical protein